MRCGCAAALRPPIHKAAVPISESSTSSVDSDMAGTGCVSQKACVTCSCAQRQSRCLVVVGGLLAGHCEADLVSCRRLAATDVERA